MKMLRSVLLLSAAALVATASLTAQTVPPPAAPRVRTSPHETISAGVDGNRVTIVYGRPYSKDPKTGAARQIWGTLIPFDKVWRCGSDEATLFVTQQPILLGGTPVPAGAYTLYVLPAADGSAKLLISRRIGQWGADPYIDSTELARVDLKKDTLASSVDQFTLAIAKTPPAGGVLVLAWETTQYSVAFTVQK